MSLPTECPQWYKLKDYLDTNDEKGWTPLTTDIVRRPANDTIIHTWNGTFYPKQAQHPTLQIKKLRVLSPIQVGGGSFPEGGVLPAQISGVPCVPGSSLKGSMLKYLREHWQDFEDTEKAFWSTLLNEDRTAWLPRAIRFENIRLKKLEPFPLNAQQNWQIFDENTRALSVQWQVAPKHPPNPEACERFSLEITLSRTITPEDTKKFKDRTIEMLQVQGIGRGTRSGFGRLSERIPPGKWEIQLTGMKPCVQPFVRNRDNTNQEGIYRWSPQVLRAHLRGYFLRLALAWLDKNNAQALTQKIFGGLGSVAQLTLVSYLNSIGRGQGNANDYTNIRATDVRETWVISVSCTEKFEKLIGQLLELSSRLGGLGPGWRRPPHVLRRFNGFRGSSFTVETAHAAETIDQLLNDLSQEIKELAKENNISLLSREHRGKGTIRSIWKGEEPGKWEDIVHGVCKTVPPGRPSWCGNTNRNPSGYAVKEDKDCCRITVFDPAVEETLKGQGFKEIWPPKKS